jgi:osmotically-inducible protein OsmY
MSKSKLSVLLLCASMSVMPVITYAGVEAAVQSSGTFIKSSAITADVKAHLLADPDVKSLHISVKTLKGGVVVLKGYVNSDDQKQKVLDIVNKIDGVTSVNDKKLVVKAVKTKQE